MILKIRQAEKQDLHAIKSILTENQLPTSDIESNLIRFFIALSDNRIIGTIGIEYSGSIALLRSLAVKEDFKNRKTGEKLLKHLLDFCKNRAIEEVYLLTTTANGYFSRFGFQMVDRSAVPDVIQQTSEFSDICPKTAIIMLKNVEQ